MVEIEEQPPAQRVAEKLQELGRYAVDVADALHAKGIKGKRGAPDRCPIALFLHGEWPDDWRVGTATAVGTIDGVEIVVPLPSGCQSFVRSFDSGIFFARVEA